MKKLIVLLLFIIPINCFGLEYIENAESGILIEANSGKILYEKDINKRLSVASMTKMVAQIIILDELRKGSIHLDDIVTVSHNASGMGGSQIYLEDNEKISVDDLLKGISVASANDATVAMAEYISGTEEKFVKKMNKKVKELGLKNTHFSNCTGLDEKDHYSSSYDMAMIARELVTKYPEILKYSSIYEDYLRENTDHKFWLVNTNKLIRFYDGADGLKTGHTDDAGFCLAATAKRGDLRLIGVVLGEKNSNVRNQETMNLLDYGFNNVKLNCIMKKGTVVSEQSISMGNISKMPIVLKDNLCVIESKDDSKKYEYNVIVDKINIPVKSGDVIGKIEVLDGKNVITIGALTTEKDVSKMSFMKFLFKTILNLIYGII